MNFEIIRETSNFLHIELPSGSMASIDVVQQWIDDGLRFVTAWAKTPGSQGWPTDDIWCVVLEKIGAPTGRYVKQWRVHYIGGTWADIDADNEEDARAKAANWRDTCIDYVECLTCPL
jgi:hypothetical protein